MSAHTPGPWFIVQGPSVFVTRLDGAHIAKIGAAENMRASARLIAAAPDLLAALRSLLAAGTDRSSAEWIAAEEQARTAISRVEGSSL